MRFIFADRKLQNLYVSGTGRYPQDAIRAFFRVMANIDQASDERDLCSLKGLRYEKLLGDRKDQHSLRLNKQWRLIVERQEDASGAFLKIVEIVDYH